MLKRVFVPVAEEPFRRFRAGVKGAEARNLHRRDGGWNALASTVHRDGYGGRPVTIRWGYGKGRPELYGVLGRKWVATKWRRLPEEPRRLVGDGAGDYIDVNRPVIVFEILGAAATVALRDAVADMPCPQCKGTGRWIGAPWHTRGCGACGGTGRVASMPCEGQACQGGAKHLHGALQCCGESPCCPAIPAPLGGRSR